MASTLWCYFPLGGRGFLKGRGFLEGRGFSSAGVASTLGRYIPLVGVVLLKEGRGFHTGALLPFVGVASSRGLSSPWWAWLMLDGRGFAPQPSRWAWLRRSLASRGVASSKPRPPRPGAARLHLKRAAATAALLLKARAAAAAA